MRSETVTPVVVGALGAVTTNFKKYVREIVIDMRA